MLDYLEAYGWHFSKKMCEYAVSKMKRKNPETGKEESLKAITKEEAEVFLKQYGINVEKAKGYDCVYVLMMGKADYLKSSVIDDAHLALFVKNYIDDVDGYDGIAFTRYYADCIGKGEPIMWEDMI